MSRDVITLQPEVEEILREVARRPGSALLRVPRKDVARTVLERDTVVHARTAGLSAAERHLVQVYREEVAFALRQAAYYRLTMGESTRGFVANRAFAPLRAAMPSLATVRTAASNAVHASADSKSDGDAMALLKRCVSPVLDDWPVSGQLAGAAHRLVPTDTSRIYASLDLRAGGLCDAALFVLQHVLASGAGSESRTVAWTNAGDLLFQLGRYDRAWEAADRACRMDERWLLAQASCAVCALFIGEQSKIKSSLARFDSALTTDPAAIPEFRAWYKGREGIVDSVRRKRLSQALESIQHSPHTLALEVLGALAI